MRPTVRGARRRGGGGGGVVDAAEFTPNRPAGLTTMSDVSFDATFPSDDNPSFSIVSYGTTKVERFAGGKTKAVAGAGPSGEYALRGRHFSGEGASYGFEMYPASTIPNARRMYVAFSFRVNPEFQGEGSGHKIWYPLFRTNGGSAANSSLMLNVIRVANDSYSSVYKWELQQVWRYISSEGMYRDYPLSMNVSDTTFTKGVWYRVECEAVIETPNAGAVSPSNGQFRLWTSSWETTAWSAPVLRMEYTDCRFGGNATTSRVFDEPRFQLYRGGVGLPTLTADADIFMHRAVWAGSV